MLKTQIVGIAVRLFAVFLAIYAARYSSSLIPVLADSTSYKASATLLFLVALLPIIAAVLLWLFPLTVAASIIPGIKGSESPGLNGNEAELIAFSILGLWVLASAIPDVFYWGTVVYLAWNPRGLGAVLPPENIGHMVGTVIELLIGVWLIAGSRGILNLVRRLRSSGN